MATKPETAKSDAVEAVKAPAKKKKFVLVIGIVFLILALAGGGWFYLAKKNSAAEKDEEPVHAALKGPPTFFPLDNMVVNLADTGGDKVAQIGITLELADAHAADTVKMYLPTIRSSILLLISQRTAEELLLIEGKKKLADDILQAASRPLATVDGSHAAVKSVKVKKKGASDEGLIRAVHFSSFIVQ